MDRRPVFPLSADIAAAHAVLLGVQLATSDRSFGELDGNS
jgi:hypothetical protein